jgi:hypothetical protein
MNRHDDGDRWRGALGRFGRGWAVRDDDVHVEPNQLGREGGKSFGSVSVESALDEDVLALDVPQFLQPLEESLPDARGPRGGRREAPEKAYPIDFRGRLGLSGERRKNETENENDHEPDPPHGHLGGNGWRGV